MLGDERGTVVSLFLFFFWRERFVFHRDGKSCYPLMDGISKMPFIFSRTVLYWKAFPKCLSFPQMNRNGSQRKHPTTTIRSILDGLYLFRGQPIVPKRHHVGRATTRDCPYKPTHLSLVPRHPSPPITFPLNIGQ